MSRIRRVHVGGMVYHVWNRSNFRSRLFRSPIQYQAFLGIVKESLNIVPLRILAYCLMPNHWHLVLYPRADGDLAKFMQRVTMTHTQRYHAKGRTVGYGHLYQGRYKSLPVDMGGPFMTLVRYVERNARRAGLAPRAEDWPWSSVHVRLLGKAEEKQMLSPWPVPEPADYLKWLNQSQGKEEIAEIRQAIKRNRPYGSEKWTATAVTQFGLESTTRSRGRPKKGS